MYQQAWGVLIIYLITVPSDQLSWHTLSQLKAKTQSNNHSVIAVTQSYELINKLTCIYFLLYSIIKLIFKIMYIVVRPL